MKKLVCIFMTLTLIFPAACAAPEAEHTPAVTKTAKSDSVQNVFGGLKLALDNYDSFPNDSAFVAAALDDLKNAGEKGGDAYKKLILKYSKDRTMTEAVKEELRHIFEDETADCIRRIDAYNVLRQCDPEGLQDSGLLGEKILLADDIVSKSMNNNKEGEVFKYYCVFWHHWDKERYGLPPTPYTTLSALSIIPRECLAATAEEADRLIVCDVTYLKSREYSIYGLGDSVTEGYSTEVRVYIQNCHNGETEELGEFSYASPISFEAYAPPKYVFGEIDFSEIYKGIGAYFAEQ